MRPSSVGNQATFLLRITAGSLRAASRLTVHQPLSPFSARSQFGSFSRPPPTHHCPFRASLARRPGMSAASTQRRSRRSRRRSRRSRRRRRVGVDRSPSMPTEAGNPDTRDGKTRHRERRSRLSIAESIPREIDDVKIECRGGE